MSPWLAGDCEYMCLSGWRDGPVLVQRPVVWKRPEMGSIPSSSPAGMARHSSVDYNLIFLSMARECLIIAVLTPLVLSLQTQGWP